MWKLDGMNIEITTACPLRCPQCYCTLEGGKHIHLETAVRYLRQAKDMGLEHVELSGGETLCYPYLYDLIAAANDLGIETNIAISGWGFDRTVLARLREAGLTNIYVSINAPTPEINSLTRDGYQYSVSALEILKESDFSNVYINWVMHNSNADYLPQMITFAKGYDVKAIMIMTPKPTSKNDLYTLPSKEQMMEAVQLIKTTEPFGFLRVESCFSPLLALASETKFAGNLNAGPYKGCLAGRNAISVSVDGLLSPCRHIPIYEEYSEISDYWEKSTVLKSIRESKPKEDEACFRCRYSPYCRHCIAINMAECCLAEES